MVDKHAAVLDLTKLAEDLGKAADDAPQRVEELLTTTANVVYTNMRLVVPVDTGRLKSSIAIQATPGRVTIGPVGVPYSTYVEYGTRRMRAQPYARPSAEKGLDSLGADAAKVGVEMITGKETP